MRAFGMVVGIHRIFAPYPSPLHPLFYPMGGFGVRFGVRFGVGVGVGGGILRTGRRVRKSPNWAVRRGVGTSLIGSSTAMFPAASKLGFDPDLNRRHAPIVYHENYSFSDWPEKYTFPMDKFGRIAHALMTTTSRVIWDDGDDFGGGGVDGEIFSGPLVQSEEDFFRPLDFVNVPLHWIASPADGNDYIGIGGGGGIGGPIDGRFLERFLKGRLTHEEKRRIGFREQCDRRELIERTVLEVVGTILTVQLSMRYGIASNVAGGTHHARSDMGAGYTILNDLAVASNFATDENLHGAGAGAGAGGGHDDEDDTTTTTSAALFAGVRRVLVIDCDVHQGDGTASFGGLPRKRFRTPPMRQGDEDDRDESENDNDEEAEKRLFTLSIHCASNYPHPKEHSTYDIGLQDGCEDREYLRVLEDGVNRALKEVKPDLVLYDAGVDVYEGDALGRICITEDGIRRRDRWVLERCVLAQIPVAAVVGGGYDRDVDALARRHAIVHEECARVWRKHRMWQNKLKWGRTLHQMNDPTGRSSSSSSSSSSSP